MTAPFSNLPEMSGTPRKAGIEIEFAGLTEEQTARIIADELGGEIREDGSHAYQVEDTALGTIKVELDIFLRKKQGGALLEGGLDLARSVVPVEIVSPPLTPEQIGQLDSLRDRLRREGALGSRDGMFLGFGVHLNPALSGNADHDCKVILAYGLLEDWLRKTDPIDPTRRLLPFVDAWPRALVDALVEARPSDLRQVMEIYAEHTQSRNHGLDLLPIFMDMDPDGFDRAFPDVGKTSGRPAFHFRLPDCRIDEADWSLRDSWEVWQKVENLAQDARMFDALCRDWQAERDQFLNSRGRWADKVSERLEANHEAQIA
ncbi:amidoligase family protein [Primorskyibacter sp. 2E233]|uniref:amidoligase family protein n=1 Tax=Primorskyibacter sp. 2E233 TaxID=3413431 RepID=UPI003BF43223